MFWLRTDFQAGPKTSDLARNGSRINVSALKLVPVNPTAILDLFRQVLGQKSQEQCPKSPGLPAKSITSAPKEFTNSEIGSCVASSIISIQCLPRWCRPYPLRLSVHHHVCGHLAHQNIKVMTLLVCSSAILRES
jgi:hypothetical protein